MPSRLLNFGQWKEGSGPPFELKVGQVQKALGCLRLIVIGFFSLLISCCISCTGVVMLMQNQDPRLMMAAIVVVFMVVFVMISKMTHWRFKKSYGKTATLHADSLAVSESSSGSQHVIPYDVVTSISIKKNRTQQLGYEFNLEDGNDYDLDPDLATFPRANYPIENSVLPSVLERWDRMLFLEQCRFVVAPDATAGQLRRACYFWIACGIPLLFIPTWWGLMADFFTRAGKLWQQSKFCGEPFFIQANGICFHSSAQPIPLSDCRLAKQDEVALVIESRSTGERFQAPITARHAYTAGHWFARKLKEGAFRSDNGVNPFPSSAPSDPNVSGHGGGFSDLKSDLF